MSIFNPTRQDHLDAGRIRVVPAVAAMYQDRVQASHPDLPWASGTCLRLDDLGRHWAKEDVKETVRMDYDNVPPSVAAEGMVE